MRLEVVTEVGSVRGGVAVKMNGWHAFSHISKTVLAMSAICRIFVVFKSPARSAGASSALCSVAKSVKPFRSCAVCLARDFVCLGSSGLRARWVETNTSCRPEQCFSSTINPTLSL